MATVLWIGFLVGAVTAVSPCVLPVLPVVFASGATGGTRRSVAIVAGLCATFGLATLFGALALSALGLPQDTLMIAGEVLLVLLGVALLVEPLGALLERPFSRLAPNQVVGASTRSGLLLGLGLGLVFVPCAGPILATIVVAASRHRFSASSVALTAAYTLGVGVPLLVLALASQRLSHRWAAIRRHARTVRRVAGALVLGMGIAVWTGALTGLETAAANGYATSVERTLTASCPVQDQLHQLEGESAGACAPIDGLANLGVAPDFAGITRWFGTPGGRPLHVASLRGHVVLVDFWTYSCINCRRSVPHVEAWYRAYRGDGLVVVGVHSPEFGFEANPTNVATAIGQLGITYPVALDASLATFTAYRSNSWPAEYLVDANGDVRYVSTGEGDYGATESALRALLVAAGSTRLPPRTDVANRTPQWCTATACQTPETYLGWQFQQDHGDANIDTAIQPDTPTTYRLPAELPSGLLAYGGTWDIKEEYATAGSGAVLQFGFYAKDVYLVVGGTGTLHVLLNGHLSRVVKVDGVPNLYTMVSQRAPAYGTVRIEVSPSLRCYSFTFG